MDAVALFSTMIALGFSLAGAIASARSARRANMAMQKRPGPPTLEQRFSLLQTKLKEAADLQEQIAAEMAARETTAATLKAEAEQAQQLASVHKEQQEAILRALRAEMATEGKKSGRQSLWANLLFFVAGVLASIVVNLLVQPL